MLHLSGSRKDEPVRREAREAHGKSFGGGTDDGDKTSSKPLPKNASKVKVKSTGPTRSFDKKGKEVWIVLYAFDLLLMKVKVKETFKVDKFGKIKELTRARA